MWKSLRDKESYALFLRQTHDGICTGWKWSRVDTPNLWQAQTVSKEGSYTTITIDHERKHHKCVIKKVIWEGPDGYEMMAMGRGHGVATPPAFAGECDFPLPSRRSGKRNCIKWGLRGGREVAILCRLTWDNGNEARWIPWDLLLKKHAQVCAVT